jgi:hypothetical protein
MRNIHVSMTRHKIRISWGSFIVRYQVAQAVGRVLVLELGGVIGFFICLGTENPEMHDMV